MVSHRGALFTLSDWLFIILTPGGIDLKVQEFSIFMLGLIPPAGEYFALLTRTLPTDPDR